MISAIKRKDIKTIVVLLLEAEGKEKEAQEFADATRITNALIDRTCLTDVEVDVEVDVLNIVDIKALVEAGDVKTAKKAFKEQFDKEHPNYKELKKLIKKASK